MTNSQFIHRVLLLALAITTISAAPALATDTPPMIVSGFQTPESVVHDAIADWYLVSNVGIGNPAALDHNGFISNVSPGGAIRDLYRIQDGVDGVTLNGPKGLVCTISIVADIDTLRIFDRFTGAPRRSVAMPNPFVPRPLFLNDVVVD